MREDTSILSDKIKQSLSELANPEQAVNLSRFFKTGKGQYGEGDIFIGIKVPVQRQIAKQFYKDTQLEDLTPLIQSPIHEHRMTSLFILELMFKKADLNKQKEIADFYLSNLNFVNNWDLVDLSAPKILGAYLFDKDRTLLYELARTDHLWKQRVGILSCFYFIQQKDFQDTLKIADILINHPHDLIHKAVGWMLREIGKRHFKTLIDFLTPRYKSLPRTMLRYAIEKFEEPLRLKFLKGEI